MKIRPKIKLKIIQIMKSDFLNRMTRATRQFTPMWVEYKMGELSNMKNGTYQGATYDDQHI